MQTIVKSKSIFSKLSIPTLLALPLLGFIAIAIWFPLLPNATAIPQFDIFSFSSSLPLGLLYGGVVVGLYWLYLYIYRRFKEEEGKLPISALFLSTFLYGLPLLITYPINATDVYRYIIRGRIKSGFGLSQFTTPPNAIPNDSFVALAGEWADATSPYGPIWELLATAVTAVTQENLGAGLLFFKAFGLLLHLGIGFLIWHLTQTTTARSAKAASWLWLGNPALLFIFVENGHNDALMLFWGVLAFYFWQRKRPYLAITFAILAPLTKPIGLLLLPFIGLACWRYFSSWREKTIFTLISIAMFVGITTTAFLPFGSPLTLIERLQNELIGGASFSPMTVIILTLMRVEIPFSFATLSIFTQAIYSLVALYLVWLAFNGRSPFQNVSNIFAGYLLQAFNFRLWYASWLFPWLLIEEGDDSFWLNTAVYFLLTTQLSVIIYAHLRFFVLNRDIFYTHIIGVLFTFGLPIVLARAVPLSKWQIPKNKKTTEFLKE